MKTNLWFGHLAFPSISLRGPWGEHVTTVLTGEDSDETPAGYTRHSWTLWNTRLNGVYRRLVPTLRSTSTVSTPLFLEAFRCQYLFLDKLPT